MQKKRCSLVKVFSAVVVDCGQLVEFAAIVTIFLRPGVPAAPPPKPYPTATVEAIQPLQIVPAQQQAVGQPIRWTQVMVFWILDVAYT